MKPASSCPIVMAAAVWLQSAMLVSLRPRGGDWEITPQSEEARPTASSGSPETRVRRAIGSPTTWGWSAWGPWPSWPPDICPAAAATARTSQRALDYVIRNQQPSGLLNIAEAQRDMYNHGLSTFVLGQAYGMTGDARIGPVSGPRAEADRRDPVRRRRLGLPRPCGSPRATI